MAKFSSPLDAIVGLTESVTKDWTKQRKAEERNANARSRRFDRLTRTRHITIKEAAFGVMKEAYQHASDDGRLPANPRQIYYAARRKILIATGRDTLESGYFLQTILRDYMGSHDCSDWDVVWDARGHFSEPHTNKVIPIGTLEVRQYLGDRPRLAPAIEFRSDTRYPTLGPENRYETVLFIEKEGFDPLLEAAQIAERFDVAIMSTKGMSVSASRLLLDRLVTRGVTKVLVLHDFDISGFSIAGTLCTSSSRYRYWNDVPIIDIGLRLADVKAMALLSEPFSTDKDWNKVSRTLKRHGVTPEEITFLERERVELNAMASGEFIHFIEKKFEEHGIEKVLPVAETIDCHARRLIEQQFANKAMEEMMPEIKKQAASATLPADLRRFVEAELARRPELPWDAAVSAVVRNLDVKE
jgi:hypothetical protein